MKAVLRWCYRLAFAFAFIFAARHSAADLLVVSVLCVWGFYIVIDWWGFRRGLATRARGYLLMDHETSEGDARRYARGALIRQVCGEYPAQKRPKRPWLAFLLVLVSLPFGFLYYRWKVTAVIMAAILAWALLSPLPIRDFIGVGRPLRHLILLSSAVLAFVDVSRTNDKLRLP